MNKIERIDHIMPHQRENNFKCVFAKLGYEIDGGSFIVFIFSNLYFHFQARWGQQDNGNSRGFYYGGPNQNNCAMGGAAAAAATAPVSNLFILKS